MTADATPLCAQCGYDLRGLPDGRCPECGAAFDRDAGAPLTPWLRGGWRVAAFWRTVWLATWRPARVAADAARPVDLRTAKGFRRWLVAWLAPWPVLVLAALYVDTVVPTSRFGTSPTTNPLLNVRHFSLPRRWTDGWITDGAWADHWTWWLDAGCFAATLAMVVAWIAMSLGVQTYFCHPRRLPRSAQDRAIALGYFAAAPLAWLPLALLAALAIEWAWLPNLAIWSWDARRPPLNAEAQFAARVAQALPALLAVALYLRAVGSIVRRAAHGSLLRALAAAAVTALAWPVLFVLFPLATLASLVLLQLMAFSAGWLSL